MKKLWLLTALLTPLLTIIVSPRAQAQLEWFDGKLYLTASERARVEYRNNNVLFDSSMGVDEDSWLLNRLRLGVGAKPLDWLQVYGELQDSREMFSTRPGANANLEEDTLDWRQGWIKLGDRRQFPLQFSIGRQLLVYGDERLIGAFDWNNVGRRFDSLTLRFETADYPGWIDFFAANVVVNDDNSFDDHADWADDFFGLYGHTEKMANHILEAYVLYRDKEDATFDGEQRQIYTLGARFVAKPTLKPWDYWVEFAGQFGHVLETGGPEGKFGETIAGWVDHLAYAGTIGVGYTFTNCVWTPRLALEYNYASGDDDPTDGDSGTFDNLYPTNHKFYGFIDLFAWKNVHNPHLQLSAKPHDKVTVRIDGHLFWLAENRDAWYRANGAPIRRDVSGSSSRFVGSEIDATVIWKAHQHVDVVAGYSHFFTGNYVGQTGTSSDADFFYTQVTLKL